MKQKKKTSVITRVASVFVAAALLLSSGITAFAGKTLAESIGFKEQIRLDDVLYNSYYFTDYLKDSAKKDGFKDVKDAVIKLDLLAFTESKGVAPEVKKLEGKDNVLYIGNDNESVTWKFTVDKAGYYQFRIGYLPVDGNGLPLSRGILIDGKELYDELANIKLYRHYVDSENPRVNNLGDQVRPSQVENQEWIETKIYDALGEYSVPLKVGLTAGEHTITLVHLDQPIAISDFYIEAPDEVKPYKDVAAEYKKKGYKNATKSIKFEAERKANIVYKTDSGITIANSSDATLSHTDKEISQITSKVYNHIGASSWKTGGQTIEWKFKVEESGLYQIVPRYYQGYGNGLRSTRQIKIDGVVPFKEFEEYIFTFDEDWHTKPLADANGNPYLVYLEKGEHTFSMTVVMGILTDVIHDLDEITSMYSNTIRNITMITGQSPDLNYDYRLEKQIPSLLGDLQKIVDMLKKCNDVVGSHADTRTPAQNNFEMSIELIEEMIEEPDNIPSGLSDLQTSLTNIGTWLTNLKTNPFALDTIAFESPDKEIEDEQQSIWQSLYALFANFFLSYSKDYNAIGSLGEANEEYETIEVWVSRGKEWCEILKDMIDTKFTAEYKINVNLNILPSGQLGGGTSPLLLAINAGTEPDVVIGVSSGVPVEYAIRGAMQDLTVFEDFKEVAQDYIPQAFKNISYHGQTFGLPETMGFDAMYIRTDIFEQLDMDLPEELDFVVPKDNAKDEVPTYTWNYIKETMLPQLYQYNMQFSYMGMDTMIFQNGGRYYSEDGLSSVLDSPEVMAGVQAHVEMYTEYGCPVSASFLNRFRSGEMPIGIGGFDTYLQLVYAAPELTGKWKMYPVPYTVRADGTEGYEIGGGAAGTCISMLSTAENKEAAWKFMKWYSSADTQAAYGNQIESILGVQSRWSTANINAFKRLPWSQDEIAVIDDFWDRAFCEQAVLGDYMNSRSLSNATNRCIISGQTVREAMEQACEEVNVEFKRKQEMYRKTLIERFKVKLD